ncbi:MAG: hypothetical protein GW880_29140, partial [Armatimonadetes bacterium]|nr:hypothetical protein [Armatimonadota bacterium]
MPLPGEASAKYGFDYESQWIVRNMLRLLREDATSMCIAALGDEARAAEFHIDLADGTREYHQCKRQPGIDTAWTIPSLRSAGVLPGVKQHLETTPATRFVFVSQVPCQVLAELAERASDSRSDPDGFRNHMLPTNAARGRAFGDVCAVWELSPNDSAHFARAHDMLGRTEFLAFPHRELARDNVALFRALVSGDASSAAAKLAKFADSNLHHDIYFDDLWRYLEPEHQRLEWAKSARVSRQINE